MQLGYTVLQYDEAVDGARQSMTSQQAVSRDPRRRR